MSIVSTAYDRILALVAAQFPDGQELTNVYDLMEVAGNILMLGYGIAIGPGTNPKRDLSCQLQMQREILVVQTRQLTVTDHDKAGRAAVAKTMFEEQLLVIRALTLDTVLSDAGGGIVSDVTYESDLGLELLATPDAAGRYLVLSSLFSCRYIENLI
jgi:hypothetical protein